MTETYYDLLGVGEDASAEAIRRAYREKAAEYHPDVSDDPDAGERFKRLQRAKDVLTDERTRRAYDRLGHEEFTEGERRSDHGERPAPTRNESRTEAGPADPFDVRAEAVGERTGIGPLLDWFFGDRATRARGDRAVVTGIRGRRSPREVDLRARLGLGFGDAPAGTRTGAASSPGSDAEPCPTCDGHGQVLHVVDTGFGRTKRTEPCRRCGGTGGRSG